MPRYFCTMALIITLRYTAKSSRRRLRKLRRNGLDLSGGKVARLVTRSSYLDTVGNVIDSDTSALNLGLDV
jgi:hypothetical protein